MVRIHRYKNAVEFMADLRTRGMKVWMVDDQVAIDPTALLTVEDRERIDLWKSYMIDELWKEKRRDPAFKGTCARTLERELTARLEILEARVWDYKEEWSLQIDFDMSSEEVYETDLVIRGTLSTAVNTLYEHSAGRVRVREDSWWHYNHGEPPSYVLSVEGLELEAVVAEAKRLQDEIDAFAMDDYIAD